MLAKCCVRNYHYHVSLRIKKFNKQIHESVKEIIHKPIKLVRLCESWLTVGRTFAFAELI